MSELFPNTIRPKPYAGIFFKTLNPTSADPRGVLRSIPRYKFMFYARFIPSASATTIAKGFPDTNLNLDQLGTWENGISFKIHSIDKPRVNMTTQELNQYNRKRQVYTKLDYQPFQIKIYDTSDDIPMKLWIDYFRYYFGDSRAKRSQTFRDPVTADVFNFDTGWGLDPLTRQLGIGNANEYNFFQRVELYAIFGGTYTQINYINPKIESIDWGNFETSSSDPAEITMTLRYEAVEYAALGEPITSNMLNMFGFDVTKTLEPNLSRPADPANKPWIPSSRITGLLETIGNLAGGNAFRGWGSLPTDLSNSISNTMMLANGALNMYSGNSIKAVGQNIGMVVAQSVQGVVLPGAASSFAGTELLTNPNAIAGYLGSGGALASANSVGGALNQFGSFNFGF